MRCRNCGSKARPGRHCSGCGMLQPPRVARGLKIAVALLSILAAVLLTAVGYVLLKLEYPKMTLEEADTALQASVRENDVRGISEKGELFLILSQTDRSSLPIILTRLENDGFVCHEIDTVENANTGEKL